MRPSGSRMTPWYLSEIPDFQNIAVSIVLRWKFRLKFAAGIANAIA